MLFVVCACPVAFAVDLGSGNQELLLESTVFAMSVVDESGPYSEFYGTSIVSCGESTVDFQLELVYSSQARVVIGGKSYTCVSYADSDSLYYGNIALADASATDTGEDFLLVLSLTDSAIFLLLPYEADSVIVSIQPCESLTVATLMDDVGSVFTSGIAMVVKVVEAVTINPILYLPIVIGLCGIGIAFFKRMKQ